ncbi:MAG: LysR family transcriptional regulator [Pseudomonadota bacterium]
MQFTLARIRALNAVIETGSFSAAARALAISQPAVTQAVREIEKETGVTLFEKRGRELHPTALCAELYRSTAEVQRWQGEAVRLLQSHASLQAGEFAVGLGNAMPGMALLAEFRRRYPGVRVNVELGSWSQIIEAVVEGRVDVGVLPNVPDDGRFRRTVCLVQDVVALVPESAPLGAGGQVSCRELARFPLIFRTERSSTRRVVDAGFRRAGLQPEPTMVLDTRDGVYEAVVNGLGIGFMWEYGSSRADRIRKLRVLDFEQGHPEHVFHAAQRSTPLVRAFCDIRLSDAATGRPAGPP